MEAETRGRVIDCLLDQLDRLEAENASLRRARPTRQDVQVVSTHVARSPPSSRQLKKRPSAMRVAPSQAGPLVRRARGKMVDFGGYGLGKDAESWRSVCRAIKDNGLVSVLNLHDNDLGITTCTDLAAVMELKVPAGQLLQDLSSSLVASSACASIRDSGPSLYLPKGHGTHLAAFELPLPSARPAGHIVTGTHGNASFISGSIFPNLALTPAPLTFPQHFPKAHS